MTPPFRFLTDDRFSSDSSATVIGSDYVIIIAALTCAFICLLGLVAIARCACLRRLHISSTAATPQFPPIHADANRGVKKKVLRSLPKLTATAESAVKLSDCAICLSEFAAGEEIRVLPQCGHGFHVSCIDTWLKSHSSCPSCRQILVVSRCQKCGGFPASASSGSSSAAEPETETDPEARSKVRERENDTNIGSCLS
ncbi:hypothetical protein TanjilG_05101 [Lupinus angustifolius]|uniref:RING-type domain-containing protein n=1 Tax=Lupinus angustifolius TaxID=3871 RepID=A0A1J7G6X6_LUPAN|nr:PREDICTED: RING-H2 finger protein ATL8-like [Lupinus angustifolius]OIV96261.1 hypothetical protein TanjilG_05101 [Lupinus angustifolius]